MKRKESRNLAWLYGGVIFFATVALIIQIAVLLYDYIRQKTDNEVWIALLMLTVVLFLAIFCTVVDVVRRKIMVEKPVNEILQATEKIKKGDFSTRLDIKHEYGKYDEYDVIKENFNVMAAELEKTEVLKTDFISNVSHELKTPLTIIQTYASALQDETLDQETRTKYAKTLTQTSKRLADLITNILKLNKLENQQIRPDFERFDLTNALAETTLSYEEWIENKGLELVCDFDDVQVCSSPSLLEMVWNNLISNAIKFTEKGKIEVTLRAKGRDAVVTVLDTGCGISAETGERLFEKFYQGDTSHSGEGNGLGLALVKKVIDMLGGEILVESKLGEGSKFTVVLKGVVYAK
ncbi:MAG: HAMP domain-containing histidine kinase [Clostridia bacterium]|nr:HAMP domain-containing histidine kinase [Clostridia bacterium]